MPAIAIVIGIGCVLLTFLIVVLANKQSKNTAVGILRNVMKQGFRISHQPLQYVHLPTPVSEYPNLTREYSKTLRKLVDHDRFVILTALCMSVEGKLFLFGTTLVTDELDNFSLKESYLRILKAALEEQCDVQGSLLYMSTDECWPAKP